MIPRFPPNRRLGLALTVLAVAVTACGDDDPDGAAAPSTALSTSPARTAPETAPDTTAATPSTNGAAQHEIEAPPGATEVDEPMPRLTVTDAESGRVQVLDLASGEVIDSFDGRGPASLASDGRFVYVIDHEHDAVDVVDTGTWIVDHGDHVHAYTAEPASVGRIEGDRPAHVVPADGVTTVFFDGQGRADVLAHADLATGELAPVRSVETSLPHHGLAISLAGHMLVSIPGATSEELPVGIEVRHDDGEVEATYDDCPEMHGKAPLEDGVLFACADGMLWITGDESGWRGDVLPYPDGTPAGDRTWSLGHGHGGSFAAGILDDDALVLVDAAAGTTRRVVVPGEPVALAVTDDSSSVLVLTADGQLRSFDAATGTPGAAGPVTTPLPAGDEEAPAPHVTVGGRRAYVSDPAAGSVLEVDIADGMRVARTFDLGGVPGELVSTGAA